MTGQPRTTVGVLGGTGPLGSGLALRLAAAGHEVVVGSRDAGRAADTAAELRDAHGLTSQALSGAANADAVRDVVVVAVPFDGVRPVVEALADQLAGRIVISCVNRLGFDDDGPHPIPVDEGSAAELIAALAPMARVFGAFHHLPAGRLRRDLEPLDMDVLITGDDPPSEVIEVVEALGVRAVPAGPLRLSRPIEELTAAIIAINRHHKVNAGVRVTGLPG